MTVTHLCGPCPPVRFGRAAPLIPRNRAGYGVLPFQDFDLHGRPTNGAKVLALETAADLYRRRGAECLTMSEHATDDGSREQFLEMAIAWHTLAMHAEQRESVDRHSETIRHPSIPRHR
jgi:hypothetical protein